jgi:hypothetical protein
MVPVHLPADVGPLRVLELTGIAAFGLSGAMTGIRKGFDLVGVLLLAELTALGGGVVRDLLIGATPPSAFRSPEALLLAAAAALVAMVAHPAVGRLFRVVLVLDAVGLGLFCTSGALTALHAGLDPVPCSGSSPRSAEACCATWWRVRCPCSSAPTATCTPCPPPSAQAPSWPSTEPGATRQGRASRRPASSSCCGSRPCTSGGGRRSPAARVAPPSSRRETPV